MIDRLAIMQPYFFPYLGYWQLIQAVDRFVVYDDVNYIKGGWINRNRLWINGEARYITLPVQGASPNRRICDIGLQPDKHWRPKLIKTFELNYAKSEHFSEVFPILKNIIEFGSDNLANYLVNQLCVMCSFLGIGTDFIRSSSVYGNQNLRGAHRVVDICKREGTSMYVNLSGGRLLYRQEEFSNNGLILNFLEPFEPHSDNPDEGSISRLSIVDFLMRNGRAVTRKAIGSYALHA